MRCDVLNVERVVAPGDVCHPLHTPPAPDARAARSCPSPSLISARALEDILGRMLAQVVSRFAQPSSAPHLRLLCGG
eukprot:1484380-Rhodomonas_salina.1